MEDKKEKKMKNEIIFLWIVIVILVLLITASWIIMLNKSNSNILAVKDHVDTTNTDKTTPVIEESLDIASEILYVNNRLNDIKGPLGWIGIVTGFSHSNSDGTQMSIEKEKDLFSDSKMEQIFVMEYILKDTSNYSKFIVLSGASLEVDINEYPTSDYTYAYMKYSDFNAFYKGFFGKDFDMNSAYRSTNSYDEGNDYVYYPNSRSGSNGLSAKSISATAISYDKNSKIYTAQLNIGYSDREAVLLGYNIGSSELQYKKDAAGNMIMTSYKITK